MQAMLLSQREPQQPGNVWENLTVQAFVEQVRRQAPEMLQKLKIHLLLHLPENLEDLGLHDVTTTLEKVCRLGLTLLLHACTKMWPHLLFTYFQTVNMLGVNHLILYFGISTYRGPTSTQSWHRHSFWDHPQPYILWLVPQNLMRKSSSTATL